jgi:hypothetical protein
VTERAKPRKIEIMSGTDSEAVKGESVEGGSGQKTVEA